MRWLVSNFIKTFALVIGLLITPLSIAGDAGVALKNDTLKAKPFSDSKNVGKLQKNDAVEIINKKGAWLQIKAKSGTGWVRLLSVKRKLTNAASVSGIAKVANGRIGSGKIVSTTGIRGLSAEELNSAEFNEAEIAKMESYRVDSVTASSYAKAAGLTKQNMHYLKGSK